MKPRHCYSGRRGEPLPEGGPGAGNTHGPRKVLETTTDMLRLRRSLQDAMSSGHSAYKLLYGVGFAPWEQMAKSPLIMEQLTALFAREEAGREPPYGRVLDLGCGSGIWAVKVAAR